MEYDFAYRLDQVNKECDFSSAWSNTGVKLLDVCVGQLKSLRTYSVGTTLPLSSSHPQPSFREKFLAFAKKAVDFIRGEKGQRAKLWCFIQIREDGILLSLKEPALSVLLS